MNLYIKLDEDGNPINHPIAESNLVATHKGLDLDNLPDNIAKFVRVPKPRVGVYETIVKNTYVNKGDHFADKWKIRKLTHAEITAKQQRVKDYWAENGFASWTFNEATCSFVPPYEAPEDDKFYKWDEEAYQADNTQGWVEVLTQTEEEE